MPIIRERATYRRTITANDRGFIVVALLDHALNRAHPTHLLFQFLLGMAIRLIDRLGCLSQVVKVAKLMRYPWQSRGYSLPNGMLPIRNHAANRRRQGRLHFRDQRREIGFTFGSRKGRASRISPDTLSRRTHSTS
jgi:hypothetical protein